MFPMSRRLWRVSRYTLPRKFRGRESWNSSPFTMTTSPTVSAPAATPSAQSTIAVARAAEKMRFCPPLRRLRLDWTLSAASSYPSRKRSYCSTS